ncbi:TniQ family protein [Kitasatospora sp. NPDC008115]|uniref:TniQ family protein n=1 Tax=Kitasatospora sp. NPDC008115 TaxID=3364022 RepID=UPI0036EC9830
MRPIPHEATFSYLHRLAHAYQATTTDLLDALGITVTRPRTAGGDAGTAEIHLDIGAQQRLATLTRTPPADLARALPNLTRHPTPARRSPNPGEESAPDAAATAAWQPLERSEQPVRACPACTLRHTRGATGRAHVHPPAHRTLCPRHRHWSPDPDTSLTTATLPALGQAWRDHQRLIRHAHAAAALGWAGAITTRWYDRQTQLDARWQHRLRLLAHANPHAEPAGKSWALYARDLVTYPETITLARILATTSLPGQPRQGPTPRTHPAITAFLTHTAHRLHLERLAPPPGDLLWTWIHHTRTN